MPESKSPNRLLRGPGDPDVRSLGGYRSAGGYAALEKAVRELAPEHVIQQVVDAKLRGRGGPGRLAGEKWRIVRRTEDNQKYVICNAYDADPRSYAVRTLLATNPHQIIEGMLLAAYAVGASEAYLYTRSFFHEGVAALQAALREALDARLVGRDILDTDFSCTINVLGVDIGFMGGEETVMMALIKGRRGMPEQRPPFPATAGLWDKPTLINSVETLANVPVILRDSRGEIDRAPFASVGSATTPGTKLVTVYDVAATEPKVVEVPFGTPIRAILEHAGLTLSEADLRGVVVGGAEGGALPVSLLDTAFDFDPIEEAG